MSHYIEISFVILTWNSEKYIVQCMLSIMRKCIKEEINYEIIIIDNCSNDNTLLLIDILKNKFSTISVINLDKNYGTTKTRNIGLKRSKGKYICILDSDTELLNGSLKSIIKTLDTNKNIGILAPKLLLPNSIVQNSVKKFPSFIEKILKIPIILFKLRLRNYDFYREFPFRKNAYVEQAISACWFFHRDLIHNVGYLDEKIFYSPEDMEFCYRLRLKGYKILYFPKFEVLHNTQQISHANPFSKTSISHFWGLLYFHSKYGNWFFHSK